MAAPTLKIVPADFTNVEAPDSRYTEFSERITFTQIFDGTYASCVAGLLSRGTVGAPTGTTGTWIVESSTVKPERGKARLTTKWQGTIYFPPQEAGFTPENLAVPVSRHPLFSSLKPEDFRRVKQAFDALNSSGANSALQSLGNSSNPDLALKLYDKLAHGQEAYYLASVRYSWTSFYAYGTQPAVNVGGYIEVPGGPFSTQAVGDGSMGWLRECDEHHLVSGLLSVVAVTRHWIGAPNGYWDLDLYAQ